MTFDNITYHIDIDFSNDHLAINLSWKYLTCKMLSTTLFRMFNRKIVLSLNFYIGELHYLASYLCYYIQILSKCVISKARFQYKNNLKTLSLTF